MSEEQRRRTAYHELGHAVVAAAFGLKVGRVELLADDKGQADVEPADHLDIRQRMAICVAGAAGGQHSDHQGWDNEEMGDAVRVVNLAADHGLSQADMESTREAAFKQAYDIVGANAQLMRRMAEKLMSHSRLDDEDLEAIQQEVLPRPR